MSIIRMKGVYTLEPRPLFRETIVPDLRLQMAKPLRLIVFSRNGRGCRNVVSP